MGKCIQKWYLSFTISFDLVFGDLELELLTHLDDLLQVVVLDTHVLDGVKKRNPIGEALLHFLYRLEDAHPVVEWPEVLWEVDSDGA